MRSRRPHATFVAVASLAAVAAGSAPPGGDARPTGAEDLYDRPAPVAPYRSVAWEVTEKDGAVVLLSYDAATDGGVMTFSEGGEVHFQDGRAAWRRADEDFRTGEVSDDLLRIRRWLLPVTIEQVVPPPMWPYVTVEARYDEQVSGTDYHYLALTVDLDRFRSELPSVYWTWQRNWYELEAGDVLELWFADDGVVERFARRGGVTVLTERVLTQAERQPTIPEEVVPVATLGTIAPAPEGP